MGLFDFLKKTKEDGPVRYSSVSKYLSGCNLPSDIKILYDIGRYQMGENTRKEQNYVGAVEAFEKLCELDKNFEYPEARKWLGQCYMAGKGVQPNLDKGIEYYDWWMERFLLHETDLVKIDDELRIYFDHGFHNYDFLLECANRRIQQEKGKNEYPIGKCLYELFLPIWCYGNVSSEMNFYRYNIKKYLRFVVDNFGDKRIGYFAEDICRNRNASIFDIQSALKPYIKEGNILALERYLNVCRKRGSKPSADLVSEKNQIWGKMARLQEKHDHEARFALREEVDKKFAEVREFFLGPSFELKGYYWYDHNKNSIYELRKQVDKNYIFALNNGLNIEENFFRYARELLAYDHAPAYFMYANIYARKIKDERLPDKTAKWFYEKAKALGYPPAVNLERVWDSQTIILAKALGLYTEEEGPKETPEARANRIFMELYEEGKYFNLLMKLQEGAKLPPKLSMRELLYNATKEMIERVGEDGKGYRRASSCPPLGSIEEYSERDYIMNDLRLLASFNEPMAYYLMALCPGNPNKYRSILSNYNDARNYDGEVDRIYIGVTESWKRRNYSYYFDGPMPESMWRKYESQIRIITQKYHARHRYSNVIDIFKEK